MPRDLGDLRELEEKYARTTGCLPFVPTAPVSALQHALTGCNRSYVFAASSDSDGKRGNRAMGKAPRGKVCEEWLTFRGTHVVILHHGGTQVKVHSQDIGCRVTVRKPFLQKSQNLYSGADRVLHGLFDLQRGTERKFDAPPV